MSSAGVTQKTTEIIYIESTNFITRQTLKLNIITYAHEPEFGDLRGNSHIIQDLPSRVPRCNHTGGGATAYDVAGSGSYTAMGENITFR